MPIHDQSKCAGERCVFHNPSAHHMVGWEKVVRENGLVERQCPHGVGHPDPDSLAYFERIGKDSSGIHGCDGCCMTQEQRAKAKQARESAATTRTRGRMPNQPRAVDLKQVQDAMAMLADVAAGKVAPTIEALKAAKERIVDGMVVLSEKIEALKADQKIEFEGTVKYDREDGGSALIAEIASVGEPADNGMFVRLQSWDDRRDAIDRHKRALQLEGKKVRITVEVVE